AEIVVYLMRAQWKAVGVAVVLALTTVAFVGSVGRRLSSWILLTFVGTAGWMSAGSLVSWTDAVHWYVSSVPRLVLLLVTLAVSILAVRATFLSAEVVGKPGAVAKALILLSIVLLLALSFRTYPVLELYHWEAYVGPIQEVRQGGWLLWDAPAQYGVLSILIPTLFPGNAWQSFYIFQALCNAVVALLMFWGLGGTRPSVSRIILASSLAATTLFFRPMTATLLLAAQMTPSGGPVRFIWPFVMLAFLFHHYRANQGKVAEPSAERRFENTCHLIWLSSLCWSLESGIYCSAVWFPAYAIILM